MHELPGWPPRLLEPDDDLSEFDCGVPALNHWLMHRAAFNHREGASRSFVYCVEKRVVAYYSLSAGSIPQLDAPGNIRRNMPDPVPIVLLGRLAVDSGWHGRKLGTRLVKDALQKCKAISIEVGVRAVLVHAKDERGAVFYTNLGFLRSPTQPLILLARVN
jgi:GNAT superfamily N-acetyltransferase